MTTEAKPGPKTIYEKKNHIAYLTINYPEKAKFSIKLQPLNSEAEKTVLAGTLSHSRVKDDLGNVYQGSVSIARWNESSDTVLSQTLVFNGEIDSKAQNLILEVDGVGKIKTPAPVQVSLQ